MKTKIGFLLNGTNKLEIGNIFSKSLYSSLNLKGSSFKLTIIFQIPSLSFAASEFRISSDIFE